MQRRRFFKDSLALAALAVGTQSITSALAEPPATNSAGWNDGLAHPIPYPLGTGLNRGIAFGGGGIVLLSFYTGYFHALRKNGLDLSNADTVVGTSAGSIFGSMLLSGNLYRMYDELNFFGDFPKLFSKLVPETKQNPSQARATHFSLIAKDASTETIQGIGRAAMAARNPGGEDTYYKTVKRIIGLSEWKSKALHISSNDCYTGERLIVSKDSNIPVDVACAASSSLPGGAGPTFLKDRLCMDGGICETSTHSDVIRGVKKALIFSLGDGTANEVTQGLRTSSMPDTLLKEIEILKAGGTDTISIVAGLAPGIDHIDSIMNPKYITPYLKFGIDRGNADAQKLKSFWG